MRKMFLCEQGDRTCATSLSLRETVMRASPRTLRHVALALVGILAAMVFAFAPAAAGEPSPDGAATWEKHGGETAQTRGIQADEALAGFESRMRHYFTFGAGDTSIEPDTSLSSQEGRNSWIPLFSLNPVLGLSLGIGAGRSDMIVGHGNPAFNSYGLGLGAAYRSDLLSLYLMGLWSFANPNSAVGGYGDFARYHISAGGTMNRAPVALGLDMFYLERADQKRVGEAGSLANQGVAGVPTMSVEQVLFAGFLDAESAVYRRFPGGTRPSAPSLASTTPNNTPTSIRAIGGHVHFMPLMETALQLGGAYLQFVEDVTTSRLGNRDESLGTSMYLRLTQGITGSLQLKAAFDYLFPSDGTRQARGDEDAYKVAAGLFWSW